MFLFWHFFNLLAKQLPKFSWEVPRKYFDMYPLEDIPDLVIQKNDLEDAYDHGRRQWHKFVLENQQWKKVIQAYLASVSFADAQIGRLLEGLKELEYAENTIIVLWADHVMHIGEKENWEKFTLWEESTRVPLMFVAPGISKPGSKCNQPVSLLDIYPTLADLAGFQPPSHCDGNSLMPQFKDVSIPTNHSALTSFEFAGDRYRHSLRNNRYRHIYNEDNSLEELYDHQTDPNEFNNLAYNKKYQKTIEEFRKELIQHVNREHVSMTDIEKDPVGYTIKDNKVSSDSFIPMEELRLDE